MVTMQRYGAAHSIGLAYQTSGINTGAGTNPFLSLATEQAVGQCSSYGCVADAHFTDAQQVTTTCDGFHAIGHGGGTVGLVHGGINGNVAGRYFERQFKNLEAQIETLADLVDGGTTTLEIRHHLGRHCLRISGNALRHHTVISGKDRNDGAINLRRGPPLPKRQPFDNFLETAKGPRRFRQLAVAGPDLGNRIRITLRHGFQKGANVVEGQASSHDGESVLCFGKDGKRAFAGKSAVPQGHLRPLNTVNTTPPEEPERQGRIRPFAELLHALRFLTRLPVPFTRTLDLPPLSQSMRLFPVAGAIIGAIVAGSLWCLASLGIGSLLSSALAVCAGLLLTGALHEDGLADTADGFGGGKTRDQRLAIMRDSRNGTYGTLALVMAMITRVALFETLVDLEPLALVAVFAACAAFSRALMVDLMWATRPARNDGLSVFAGTPGRNGAAFAIVTAAGLTLATGLLLRPESGLLALAAGLAVTALMRRMTVKLIGGQTGDVCGAVQVLSEIAMLTAFAATIG